MVHEFRHHQASRTNEGSQRFPVAIEGRHRGAGHRAQIAELRGGRGRCVLTRHGHPKERRRGESRQGHAAELGPSLAVQTGKTGKDRSDATQPQPRLRIVHRIPAADRFLNRLRSGRRPRFKEATQLGRRGQNCRKPGIRRRRFSSHQAGVNKGVSDGHPRYPGLHIEIPGPGFRGELKLVLRRT